MHSAERREPSSVGSGVALTASCVFLGVSPYYIQSPWSLKMQERSYDVMCEGQRVHGANASLVEADLDETNRMTCVSKK